MGAKTVVSDDEEEHDEDNIRHAFDIEAAEAVDEEGEEEGHDEYEKDNFIVDDVEDEAGESSREEIKARKKKKKKRLAELNNELEEEDYKLLQEANVTGFNWSKPGRKKFKRLKKAGINNDKAEKESFFHDNEAEDGGHTTTTAEENLRCSLFGDDEGMLPDELVEEDQHEEDDMGEEDEMADFIVDDEEMDANDLPVRGSKKRGAKQAWGIPSSDLKKTRDTFGCVDKHSTRQKKGVKVKGPDAGLVDGLSSKKLEDEFEPSFLAHNYMTGKDDQIRETDLPERFQLFEEISGLYPQNEDTLSEAKWIYDRVFGSLAILMRKEFQHIIEMNKEEVVKEISNVLQMCHDKKLEIPFVAMYRKELCLKLLEDQKDAYIESADDGSCGKLRMYKALWAIDFWDRKWILLNRRKNALKEAYEKCAGKEASIDPIKLRLLGSILELLDNAESERTVDDIDAKFNLHFPPDEVEVEQGQFKRPRQKSMYIICRKSGLGVVTKAFGLTPEKLGKNLLLKYKKHGVEDASNTPEDVADKLLSENFRDPQLVLKGARHMVAVEISCEPAVKEFVRCIYMEQAVLTTRPTADGKNTIDDFHQYAGVKWLLKKPIRMFGNSQWLLIQKAEAEKLLQVTICLPRDKIEKSLIPEVENYYLSHSVTQTAQLWNEQRKLVLKDALFNYILPGMEKEARIVLSMRAKSSLVEDYKMQLWKKVSCAPYQHSKYDKECPKENAGTRVMACCQGCGKDPTIFVMLDASGEMMDMLSTSYLSARSKNPDVQNRKENDWQRLSKFITHHRPEVVVLGASSIRCRYLKDEMEAKLKMSNECPDDPEEIVDSLDVVYADEILPRLYEMSHISQNQLPKHRGIVRRAVALGRYLLNPLAMVATLCGPGREILSLKLHSLEHFLSTDDRYECVEQVMITVTNQVGVDINLAASHEWMFAPLQFIAGLGPRKAASMQKAISRVGRVYSRRELLNLGAVKRLVFINAVGFLRIRGTGQSASSSQVMDPIDDSRIHPESYELAKKMVKDVYYKDVGQDIDDTDETQQKMAIEHIKNHPHLLKALDINDYAENLEQQSDNRRQETLCDIKFELLHGFQDWRLPYRQPDEDEQFLMLTGESEETLSEGKVVQATVRRVLDQLVICYLESGITGRIMKDDLSDGTCTNHVEKITEGSILTCRVKSVQKERYLVELSCKLSELSDQFRSRQERDYYYAGDEFILRSEQERERKDMEHPKKLFKHRMIAHPQFQNISESEAIKNLSDKEPGESIIRPSSKGPSYLTLTLKVWDRVYAHKDIVEGGKDHRDFAGFLRIGKTLSIGEETFEGLDEIIARYVNPLVSNLKAILAFRKFRMGTKEEIDEALQKENYESPETIPHCISVSHEHPGSFVLSYFKSTTPHHEYFGLYPKGFKFRKRMFDNLDNLVDYFQKHVNDLVQDSIPPVRSVAAMVLQNSLGSVQTCIDRERSSMPGSRKGGSSFNGPRNGRGRGRRGGGGSWKQGRGDGSRGGTSNEGRGGGGRGGNWNERRGGGRGGSWNEGRGSGGWKDGRESGGRVSDSMDSGWGGGSGGGITDGGWGRGGSGDIMDGGWDGGSGGRVNGSMDHGWGGVEGGVTDGGWGGVGSAGSLDSGWGAGGRGKNREGGQGGESVDNVLGGGRGGGSEQTGGGSGEGDKSEGQVGGMDGWGGTGSGWDGGRGGGSEKTGGGSGEGDKSEGRVGGMDGWGGTGSVGDGGGSGVSIDSGWGAGGGGKSTDVCQDGGSADNVCGRRKGGVSEQTGGGSGEGDKNEGKVVDTDGWGGTGGGSVDGGWGGDGGNTEGGWGGGVGGSTGSGCGGGGGGSTDGGWDVGGGRVGGGSLDGGWGGGGGGGGSTDGSWGAGRNSGSTNGGWGGGNESRDGGCGAGGGGGSIDGGWGGRGGGGGRSSGGWGGGRGGGRSRDGGWGGGRSSGGNRDVGWGRGGKVGERRDGAWARGGGRNGEGRWSEGRGGGFGRTKNEGRFGSNGSTWSEDKGNRWGRNSGRGRGRGSERGVVESDFNSRQRQCSGSNTNYGSFSHKQERDACEPQAGGWGSNSGNNNSKSPAREEWISDSGGNGKDRQGNNGWNAGEQNEGWNASTVRDIDVMSKDRTSGWDTVNKTDSSEMSGAGVTGGGWGGTEGAKTKDSWCITEAPKSNIGWGGRETEGKNDGWAMSGVGTENDGGASDWAKDPDGWGEAMPGGSVNTGGTGWGP